MSFVRNFALGQQIAQTALDTYYDAREKARLRAIGEAKPEEIQNSYTTQDAEQLHALANAKDAQGNPYYNLEANADGSYGLKANFAYAGQDGQMVQPGGIAATFAPRAAAVEFMGTRYAPEDLNEDRIAALRARAMADVISERDPVRGLQMRRSIKSDEREDEWFSWERQQQPLKQRGLEQQVRQGEIAVADAESAQAWKKGFGEAMAQYTGSQEQIAETAQYVNKNSRSITMGAPDPKTGLMNLSVVTPSGDSVFLQLNRADQARLYAAATMMRTHPMEALKEMSAVNKDLAEAFARENQLTKFLVDNNNDVVAKGHKMKVDEQELGIRRGMLRLQDERNNQERNLLKQRIQTLEETLGRKLTESEILSLGGLKAGNTALAFNETDGGVVFTDGRTGLPVGKLDPQLGIVPYGQDPRSDQRLLRMLQEKNIRIATGQTQDGLPAWVYITPSGRAFTTPEEALNPPIRKSDVEDLSGLRQLLEQTRAQLVAAGKSGDQRAIQPLARRVFELDRTLRAAARERFGERADEYLRDN